MDSPINVKQKLALLRHKPHAIGSEFIPFCVLYINSLN